MIPEPAFPSVLLLWKFLRISCSRACLYFHDAGDGAELTAHFLDHAVSRLGHGVHGQSGEHEGQHTADQQTDGHPGIQNVDAGITDANSLGIADEQSQSSQSGGADGEALPIAAVVLPTASSLSVISRTL